MSQAHPFRFGRRPLLAGALATAAGRFLLRPLLAEAQGTASPRRLLLIHRPCGSWPDNWFPRGGSTLSELSPLLSSFEAVKHKMAIMKGVSTGVDQSQNGDKHAMGALTMLTGHMPIQPPGTSRQDLDDPNSKSISAAAPSLDQYLLQNEPGQHLRGALVPSLQLAGTTRSAQGAGFTCLRVISHAGAMQPMFGEARTDVAFNSTFGHISGDPNRDPEAIARAKAQGKSVLDFVRGDLNRIRGQAPRSQQVKLEAHLDAIRQLEVRLDAPADFACIKPTLRPQPREGGNQDANGDEVEHQSIGRNMLSIIKTAFQCDITRVASLTFADGNSTLRPRMFVPGAGFSLSDDHHGVSHAGSEGDAVTAKTQTDKFYGDMVGEMLAEMDQIPEGDAGETLLDHTLVVYFSECSIGDDHNPHNMPVALFGGKFLNLNRGRYHVFTPELYINDVWTSMLNAWGLDLDQYGDPRWCTGSGPGAAPGLFG